MGAQPLTQLRVGTRVPPGVELDRRVAELEALVRHVEELLDGGERRRGRVGRNLLPVGAEQAVNRDAEHPTLEIRERNIDEADEPDRELLRTVELPQPVPE